MNVDKIFVISIKNSKERQRNVLKQLQHLPFEFYLVDRDNEDPKRGCYNSHRNLIKYSKEKGLRRILVFEDDIILLKDINFIINRVNKFLKEFPDYWKFLMLGYLPLKTCNTKNKEILKIFSAACAHAYIVNLENTDIPPKWSGEMIDLKLFFNKRKPENGIFGLNPICVGQSLVKSSIDDFHVNGMNFYKKVLKTEENMIKLSNTIDVSYLTLCIIILPIMIISLFISYKLNKNIFKIILILSILYVLTLSILFIIDHIKYSN